MIELRVRQQCEYNNLYTTTLYGKIKVELHKGSVNAKSVFCVMLSPYKIRYTIVVGICYTWMPSKIDNKHHGTTTIKVLLSTREIYFRVYFLLSLTKRLDITVLVKHEYVGHMHIAILCIVTSCASKRKSKLIKQLSREIKFKPFYICEQQI